MSGYSIFHFLLAYYLLIDILGLDPARYRSSGSGLEEKSFAALDSQMSDTERFKDASPFLVRCRHCQGEVSFVPLNDREVCKVVSLPFLESIICLSN